MNEAKPDQVYSILDIARECGANVEAWCRNDNHFIDFTSEESLASFTKRIQEMERERCAGICDAIDAQDERDNGAASTGGAASCAAAIRAGISK